jgi:hypothetical protein
MDAAPRGLAPGGPGATGVPLLDCILADPGLAGAVFGHLAPADVLGLRASCTGGRAAVAGHAWGSAVAAAHAWAWSPLPPPGAGIREAAESGNEWDESFSPSQLAATEQHDVSGGRAALARWRACYPHARSVVVRGARGQDGAAAVTDADVAALAAGDTVTRLGLVGCRALTDAALAPFIRLASLALMAMPHLSGACWGGLTGRLRSVTTSGTGAVTDAHLVALSGCTHVRLGAGTAVTDAGVAAHLAARVTHLSLDVTECRTFDGSGLRACRRLVALRLANDIPYFIDGVEDVEEDVTSLVPDALAGCAARLASLELDGVDGGDALFAAGGGGLPALRRAALRVLPALTDAAFTGGTTPALAELAVEDCNRFVGGARLGPLPGLASLLARFCNGFTGRALAAGCTPRLQWLAVDWCESFAQGEGGDGSSGGGSTRSRLQPPLVGAYMARTPALTDAWLARAPGLTHLMLSDCSGVVGSAAVLGGRLPALTHLAVRGCRAFTGGWLSAAADGGAPSTRLEALSVRLCPAVSLPDVLAPQPHPRLRRAHFEGDYYSWSLLLTDELLGARLPALRQLTVRRSADFLGGPGLGAALPALTDLTVEKCFRFSGAGLGGLPSLQRLGVSVCLGVDDEVLVAAAEGCPSLVSVTYGSEYDAEEPPDVTPSALGPGWAAGPPRLVSTYRCPLLVWTATRVPSAVPAAAATLPSAGGGSGGGGGDEEARGGARSPPAKRARADGGEDGRAW